MLIEIKMASYHKANRGGNVVKHALINSDAEFLHVESEEREVKDLRRVNENYITKDLRHRQGENALPKPLGLQARGKLEQNIIFDKILNITKIHRAC
jgi:hypothetical protein